MKVFWSWQADTHGKTGRHFVREALADAIKLLKVPSGVEEPYERDLRESIHLDHDRKDVSGTPSIADVIFRKIDQADVFIADVTPVAELTRLNPTDGEPPVKKLINSNVAIEYGYAVRAVTDELILLVQNTHYGNRSDLPFDLQHKGSPIQYKLAPDASADERKAEKAKLVGMLVSALRACLVTIGRGSALAEPKFQPIKSTTNRAFFWEPGEVLARYSVDNPIHENRSEYSEYFFDEPRALYLRLIPTVPRMEPFSFTKLMNIQELRRVRLMTRTFGSAHFYCNKYGALSYERDGAYLMPLAMTQLHKNGEIWAITRDYWQPYAGEDVVRMGNVDGLLRQCLENSVQVAGNELGIDPPYEIEVGVVGLRNMCLTRPPERMTGYINQFTDRVHDDERHVRMVLHDPTPDTQGSIVRKLLTDLWALVGIEG